MRVRPRIYATVSAITTDIYARKLYDRKTSPNQPSLSAKGNVFLKQLDVAERVIDGSSDFVSFIREPPKKLPKPTPKVVSARPVTF